MPRAYDMFRAYEGMKGRKIKKWKVGKFNTRLQKYNFFKKIKFYYKPTCEMGSVWYEHISQYMSSQRSYCRIKYEVRIIRVSQLSVHPLH
jgi:hypothetical protein